MEFSKKIKSLQFSMVQGSLNPNITFLSEKLKICHLPRMPIYSTTLNFCLAIPPIKSIKILLCDKGT